MRTIDLHAHILPDVDDGPATLAGSLAFARAAVAAGTAEIAATPHVNERRFIEPEAIGPAVAAFQARLDAERIPLVLHTGAEIALPRLLDLDDRQLDLLRLGGGPYLLLECPLASVAGDFEPLLHDVHARGYGILLAHPERCPSFIRDPARLLRLVEAGALVQVTASALTGTYGERVRQFALRLMREDLVHVVASDAHDHRRRPPGVVEAIRATERTVPGVLARGDWYAREVPEAILAGDPVPEPPPLTGARGGRRLRHRLARALGATAA